MSEDPREVVAQVLEDLTALLSPGDRLIVVVLLRDGRLSIDLRDKDNYLVAMGLDNVSQVLAGRLERDTHADILCESNLDIGEYEAVTGR